MDEIKPLGFDWEFGHEEPPEKEGKKRKHEQKER